MSVAVFKVLIKIFSGGFYKEHGGLLIFLFGLIISSFFYMNVLHYAPNESMYHHLIMLVSFVSNPLMMAFVFFIWLIYIIKTCLYVNKQLKLEEQRFLFHSLTALPFGKQYINWFIVQIFLSLPILVYGIVSIGVGIVYRFYLTSSLILIFLFFLMAVGAFSHTRTMFKALSPSATSVSVYLPGWRKPLSVLFLYHLLNQEKLSFLISKALSLISLVGMFYLFQEVSEVFSFRAVVMLLVAASNSILIYKSHEFEERMLFFKKNLPFSRAKVFLGIALCYLLLLLPEIIWISTQVEPSAGLFLIIFTLSILLLCRSILYVTGLSSGRYLKWIFFVFVLFVLMSTLEMHWLIPIINTIFSFLLFYSKYYSSHD